MPNATKPRRPDGCFPVELLSELTIDQVPAHRYLDCPSYGACLSFACVAGPAGREWRSFSCARCPKAAGTLGE